MTTSIKFCGLNDQASVQAAGACQVDAVGFVFFPASPRAVTLEQVSGFQRWLPPFVTRVGLVVDPKPEFVRELISSHCIDVLQFHGQETGDFCEQFQFPYMKALPAQPQVAEKAFWQRIDSEYPHARAFLLDTPAGLRLRQNL
jgi:phosphoribosylanthranilate isomerase